MLFFLGFDSSIPPPFEWARRSTPARINVFRIEDFTRPSSFEIALNDQPSLYKRTTLSEITTFDKVKISILSWGFDRWYNDDKPQPKSGGVSQQCETPFLFLLSRP